MYVDRRARQSDPSFWQSQLAHGRGLLRDRLRVLRLHYDAIWKVMQARLPPQGRILDAGCGRGEWIAFLANKGYTAVGLDYSPDLIRRARQIAPSSAELIVGSIFDMPFADDYFDAVISWGVIEHDENGPQAALAEMRRVLRANGHLFVTVPVDSFAMTRASVAENGPPEGQPFFQYHFRPEELSAALTAAGFTAEKVYPGSHHYALAFPRVHAALSHRWPRARDSFGIAVRPYVNRRSDTVNMILGVAVKPNDASGLTPVDRSGPCERVSRPGSWARKDSITREATQTYAGADHPQVAGG